MSEEIEKNLKRCSRCALCLKNCPIYNIKKDENQTPRGLIIKILGFLNGNLEKKQIIKDLKICLNCSRCKANCPSKVDTSLIFAYKNAQLAPSKISQRLFLKLKLLPLSIVYFLNLFKKNKKIEPKHKDILYFKGCVAKNQHKITFLDNLFYNPDFSCCALPYLTGGDIKNYKKAKERNIELIKKAKYVVFDCASCYSAVLEYEELNENEKKKLIFISDIFDDMVLELKQNSKYKGKKVTFHKPCHMIQKDFEKIENMLNSIKDINYISAKDDSCCGFGGSYFLFHPIISTKIALKKARVIKDSQADLILTACPSCTMGLRYNQIISFNFKKTLELRDFMSQEIALDDFKGIR